MDENKKDYEFNDNQNTIIRELASAMNFIGIATVVLGVLMGVAGMIALSDPRGTGNGISSLIQSLLYVVIGGMTTSAAGYFSQVVKTEGNDITFLMQALDKLRAMYVLQRILFLIVIVLLVLVFFLLLG